MIEIDGSHGEGGGQILRTALSLSCLFRKSFRIVNIRRNRRRPGLMPQHLATVRAAKAISSAQVAGDHTGSTELTFSPRSVKAGEYAFDIGTAGSALLVLQAVLPPLLFAENRSVVTLTGGTHVPFSPSYHYVSGIFSPALARLGMKVSLSIESHGFYPRGGGKIRAEIRQAGKILPLRATERGKLREVTGCSAVGRLPGSIAERQRKAAQGKLRSLIAEAGCAVRIELVDVPTPGQGTFLYLHAEAENAAAGFTSLGAIGKRAEAVGEEAGEELLRYYSTGAALDPHLPDQIVLYLSLCEEGSAFTTSRITQHLPTNLWVMSLFHAFTYSIDGEIGEPGKIRIN